MKPPFDYVTFFNSRGMFTREATGEALQSLIDDLAESGEVGGTVWVCTNVNLLTPLKLYDGVVVDFQGYTVQLGAAASDPQDAVQSGLVELDAVQGAGVENVRVEPLNQGLTSDDGQPITCDTNQTSPIILVRPEAGHVQDCTIRRILTQGWEFGGTAPNHCFDGVVIDATLSDESSPVSIRHNSFRDIYHVGVCNGLLLRAGAGAEIEGNMVSHLVNWRCKAMVTFVRAEEPQQRGFCFNTFEVIRGQADFHFTHAAVRGISGYGNHFDHTFLWDFWYTYGCCPAQEDKASAADFHVEMSAIWTYLNSESINGLLNESTTTRTVPPKAVTSCTVSSAVGCTCSVEPFCSAWSTSPCPSGTYFPVYVPETDKNTYCYCPTGPEGTCAHILDVSCPTCRPGAYPDDDLPHSSGGDFLRQSGEVANHSLSRPTSHPWPAPETRIDHHPPKILTRRDLAHPEPSLAGGIHTSPNKVLTWRDFSPGVWFW